MKRRLIQFLVITSGLLCGASLLICIASYALGLFALLFSPNNGYCFLSIQRGTLAFRFDVTTGPSAHTYLWWLQRDEMFAAQTIPPGTPPLVHLPDQGEPKFALGPQNYPWHWSFIPAFEGFIPIWILILVFATTPLAWAAGFFDRFAPPASKAHPKISTASEP